MREGGGTETVCQTEESERHGETERGETEGGDRDNMSDRIESERDGETETHRDTERGGETDGEGGRGAEHIRQKRT